MKELHLLRQGIPVGIQVIPEDQATIDRHIIHRVAILLHHIVHHPGRVQKVLPDHRAAAVAVVRILVAVQDQVVPIEDGKC